MWRGRWWPRTKHTHRRLSIDGSLVNAVYVSERDRPKKAPDRNRPRGRLARRPADQIACKQGVSGHCELQLQKRAYACAPLCYDFFKLGKCTCVVMEHIIPRQHMYKHVLYLSKIDSAIVMFQSNTCLQYMFYNILYNWESNISIVQPGESALHGHQAAAGH